MTNQNPKGNGEKSPDLVHRTNEFICFEKAMERLSSKRREV
jgi:hypothetical protein